MMKIGIFTLFGLYNYGNRLQNYAMQKVLERKGCEAITIVSSKEEHTLNKFSRYNIKHYIKNYMGYIFANEKFMFSRRYIKFLNFQHNIKTTLVDDYREFAELCDFIVCGSDQVWNPYVVNEKYMLEWAPETKRVAISASFGVDELPNDRLDFYKNSINQFHKVSVREEEGRKIIKNILNKEVDVLIDPTFMLSRADWDIVATKIKGLPSKYILLHLIGTLSNEREKLIKQMADKNNLSIINLSDIRSKYYASGPAEWLSLIKNAELVCTDSFHSIVFSIIYNKNFVVYDREDHFENMSSRITCILKKFELEDRKTSKINEELVLKCDFEKANDILTIEQKKFNKFVDEIISDS